MEKKNNCARVRFSTILWGVLAVLLCAAPCSAKNVISGETLDIGYDYPDVQIDDILYVWGTVNLYPGAYIAGNPPIPGNIEAFPGSEVNIRGGSVAGWIATYKSTTPEDPDPNVTVYGPSFQVGTGEPFAPPADMLISDTLNVLSESGEVLFSLLLMSDINIHLRASGVTVAIDIKPGSDLNPINPGSNGLIPVAILTTDDFNAADVNSATVTLAGAKVAVRGKAEKLMARLEDVDGDGDLDLLVQVKTQSEGALWKSGPVTLTGKTYDGQDIEGTDEVTIVPPE